MNDGRLSSAVEATGLVRRIEAAGDFAAILRRGDPDRGALLLMIRSRGRHVGCLERMPAFDGGYRWHSVGPGESSTSDEIDDFLAKRARFDADSWVIELDIAEAERFIAETTLTG
ncbi:MAG TPA: DUF1491 family protein [Sphingomicrobium sp.]|nr:DUF1491 family protein [Sphingomicrobium sp.]